MAACYRLAENHSGVGRQSLADKGRAGTNLIFSKAIAEFKAEYAVQVYGFCLMTNHVHLVLQPGGSRWRDWAS